MLLKMLKQTLDIGLFGIHIGYTFVKLELLHKIIIGLINFGYWHSIASIISSIIAICVFDINFDMLANQYVLNCVVKPLFHYIELIGKIDTQIYNIVNKNKYSSIIRELQNKFSYWLVSIMIRYIQFIFNQVRANDGLTEQIRTNPIVDIMLHLDYHIFIGNDPANAVRSAIINLSHNNEGNALGNNNNNIYQMLGIQHRNGPSHTDIDTDSDTDSDAEFDDGPIIGVN